MRSDVCWRPKGIRYAVNRSNTPAANGSRGTRPRSADTARLMVFKLVREAEKNWLRLRGQNLLPKVIDGVTFKDGVEDIKDATNAA